MSILISTLKICENFPYQCPLRNRRCSLLHEWALFFFYESTGHWFIRSSSRSTSIIVGCSERVFWTLSCLTIENCLVRQLLLHLFAQWADFRGRNFIWDLALTKVYANCLMSTLNARAALKELSSGHSHPQQFTSIGGTGRRPVRSPISQLTMRI